MPKALSGGSLGEHLARAAAARSPDRVIDLTEQRSAEAEEVQRCEVSLGPGLRCKYPAAEDSTRCTHHILMEEPAPKKKRPRRPAPPRR